MVRDFLFLYILFGNLNFFSYICALTINKKFMEKYNLKKELAIQNAILNNTVHIEYKDEDELNQSENGTDTVHTICESESEIV